jgi:hypothetical protein
MSIETTVQCEVCGAEGSVRFGGHDHEDLPHPMMVETDSGGRCALCGQEQSLLHDKHDEINPEIDPIVE